MNCIDFMENNSHIFKRINNREYKVKDSFHIGTITAQNDDNTFDIISTNNIKISSIPAMNTSTSDLLKQGHPVLFLHGSEKSLTQIYELSPWIIGNQMPTD